MTLRVRAHAFVAMTAMVALTVQAPFAADEPSLDDVVKRVAAYVDEYGPQFAAIVAEEQYTQRVDTERNTVVVPDIGPTRRVIRSDVVLTRLADGRTWVAFRDAFDVDGSPVRGREDRLVALLSTGGDRGFRQAAAIANESARFNIGSRLITRNINVPTFVIQLLQGENRKRFRFSTAKAAASKQAATRSAATPSRFVIEYRERERPTIVRQARGGDQPLRGTMSVDPLTGEVWETTLTWERGPAGQINVAFGRTPGIDVLVPVRMVEQYQASPAVISGEAVYSNFRRFQTSVRVVDPSEVGAPTDAR